MTRWSFLDALLAAFVAGVLLGAVVGRVTASRPAASAIPTSGTAPSGVVDRIPGESDLAQRPEAPWSSATPRPVPSSRPAVPPSAAGATIVGLASWYRDPRRPAGAEYAAAPGYHGDPYPVVVCGFEGGRSTCLSLFVSDDCGCLVGTTRARVIDLSPAAFAQLAPLGQGLVRVSVERLRG